MKLGIFGGSFDPLHFGHLILADQALESAELDQVLFVPTAMSPLKPDGPIAKNRQRLEMLQLAVAGDTRFAISEQELERDGISYTVDTLESIHVSHPDDELFLIIGSDSLADFGKWKNTQRICELATPLVASRHGSDRNLDTLAEFVSRERLDQIRKYEFDFPRIELSSTELRNRISSGKSVRYRMPRAVECYIQTAKLYLQLSS